MKTVRVLLWLIVALTGCSLDRTPSHAADSNPGVAAFNGGFAGVGLTAGSGGFAGVGAQVGQAGTGAGSAAVGRAAGDGAAGVAGAAGAAGDGAAGNGVAGSAAAGTGAPGADACGGCDDGVFCTGIERCIPGAAGADSRGCVVTPSCRTDQKCNEATRSCSALCTPTASPVEVCDGVDNDCNGRVDDGFATFSCYQANTTEICTAGQCVITYCSAGYADCNKLAADGCEQWLDPTPGDCQTSDCAGTSSEDNQDLPAADGNPCTIESCDHGMPTVKDAPDGQSCRLPSSGSGGSGSNTGSCMQGTCM